MSTDIRVQATLIITEADLRAALALASGQTDQIAETEEERRKQAETELNPAPKKRGRPKKVKPETLLPPPPKDQDIHLKLDFDQPKEIQYKSAIVQAAQQAHGDAIARKIMQNWTDEDTKSVVFAMSLFGTASIQTVAKAAADTPEAELTKTPRLFLMAVFKRAAELSEVAEPVGVPRQKACGICEGVGVHSPGCPAGIATRVRDIGDGGAVPSRVHNAAVPAQAEKPEICALGGIDGGCPIPQHGVMLQGGAHIAIHDPAMMRALRAATGGAQSAEPQFAMPQPLKKSEAMFPEPPAKRGPGRPRKTKKEE